MKVLIISNLYEPYARGGAEAVVQTVAGGLQGRGYEVVVLTTGPMRYGFFPRVEEMIGRVRVLRFSPWNFYFVRNDHRFPKPIRALARLWEMVSPHPGMVVRAIIKKERPDVVMTHNLVGFGMRVPAAIKKSGVRHIHTLHDVQLIHPSGILLYGKEERAEHSRMRRWYERRTRQLFGSPDVVASPSKWLLDFHTSRGFFPKSKTIVLPNPVECPKPDQSINLQPTTYLPTSERSWKSASRLPSEAGRQRAKRSYNLQPLHLLCAGQLEPHKGVQWLLEKNREQRKENRVVIEFAGSGSLAAEIKKAAERDPEHIIFHGKLNQEALYERFAKVDALAVPSLCYENAPRVISEALSVGLPVIASRIGGIPEMICDGGNGFLFTPGDAGEFQQAISKLREKKIAPQSSTNFFTSDQYVGRLLEL